MRARLSPARKIIRRGRERLKHIRARVLLKCPGAAISADQLYRERFDLAVDFCEDVPPCLPPKSTAISAILSSEEGAALPRWVRTIHVSGWYGDLRPS